MSCRDLKTPKRPNMKDVPIIQARKDLTGSFIPDWELNIVKYLDGIDLSQSELSIPKFQDGAQVNTDNTSAVSGGGSSTATYFRVLRIASQSISSSARFTVLWDTSLTADLNSWYNTSDGKFTPQEAGVYVFTHNLELSIGDVTMDWDSSLFKNGSEYNHFNHVRREAATSSAIVQMNGSTDYVDVRVRVFSPLPNTITATSGFRNQWFGYKIGGIP